MTEPLPNQAQSHGPSEPVLIPNASPLSSVSSEAQEGVAGFLKAWITAWNARDACALASLHTADCVTVNRYGTLIPHRKSAEEALSFLLGPHGPFGNTQFEPMKLVAAREIAPNVAIIQASWTAPALAPDGKIVPGEFNRMMMSYTLIQQEGRWKTTQIDGHNVEHMELPYSNPEQMN